MRLVSLALVLGLALTACSSSSSTDGGGPSSGDAATGSPDGSSSDASAAADSGGRPPAPNVTLTNESMQVNGQTRTYILGVPSTYDASKSYPLVMVLHGNPGDAEGMTKSLPFDGASKQDAILAYPNGVGNNWDLSTPPAANQDIAFIRVLANEIATKRNIDKTRVFGSGYSGGGFFLNQLACRVPNVFKAFASHSGGGPFNMNGENYPENECVPCSAGKTPSIHTHGKKDTEVGVEGGYYAAACWSTTNNCAEPDPNTWSAATPPPCKAASGCGTSPVVLCWVDDLAHNQWSEGANAAWAFFSSLP